MNHIIEGYLSEVRAHLRTSAAEKDQIIRELRTHLEERVREARGAHPDRETEALTREVLERFGNPHELAIAYTPEGATELRLPSGETVLRVGKAVGRGTGKVLKWVGVGTLALGLIVAGLGIWAFYEVRPYVEGIIEQNVQEPVYRYTEHCRDAPCQGQAVNQTFYVQPGARYVSFDLWASVDDAVPEGGSVAVQILDPDGTTRFSRTLALEPGGHLSEDARWAPVSGDWRVEITYADFQGRVHLSVETAGTADITR